MLTKSFIEFLYEAAHIQRWNEHIRPMGFTELDKQAHKMMIVYVLCGKVSKKVSHIALIWKKNAAMA